VAQRFGEIEGGEVAEQTIESSFDGEDVELRNVVLVLPGESERRIVVVARRDSARGIGLASSAAATGALIELAESFGGARHSKTLVFVSTSGGSDGGVGAREFAESFSERELVDGAVVLEQPGATTEQPPFVIPWSAGPQSTSIQLTRTAATAVTDQTDRPAGEGAPFGGLMRLALPSGLGEQAVLIEEGFDAIALSSAGERPLAPADDGSDSLSPATLGRFGRAALALIEALDATSAPPEHGPDAYVQVAGNLIPGWSLGLLALSLILPAALTAFDATARSWRRGEGSPRDLAWAVSRSLPFVGALLLAYLLAVTGLAPQPQFPYDPGRFGVGWRAAIVLACLTLAFALIWIAAKPLRVPRGATREALAAALGLLLCVSVIGVWLINPYLALLLVPAAHSWLTAVGPAGSARLAGAAIAVGGSLVLPAVAVADLAGRLEVGVTVPWHILLMVVDGQLGFVLCLMGCLIAGGLVGVVAAARAGEEAPAAPRLAASGRFPRFREG
jgi:MFS family permease